MKRLTIAIASLGLVASYALAGQASGVIIDSNVKGAHNLAKGMHAKATQNIHSVDVGRHGVVEYIYIKGTAEDVSNVARGMGSRATQNVGSIKVK